MRSLAIAPMVAVALAAVASAQGLTEVSLDDALRLALARNPTVRAKEFELQSTRANEITAGLRPNPTASYMAEQFGGGSQVTPQHTVTLAETIETGGKRRRRIASARAATRVTGWELADTRRQTIYRVKKAFTDILVAQDTLALAQANLKTLDEVERLQRLRAERGEISPLDLNRIQVQRFAFERDAADATQALETAKVELRTAVGPDALAPEFTIRDALTFHDIPLDRSRLYRAALDNRPDLRAAIATEEKSRTDLRLAHANAWWDVTPQLEYQRIGPDNTLGFGLSVPLRLFDRNQGEIARTKAEIARATAEREAAAVQVLADVDTALATATSERQKVLLLEQTYLPKAQQVRDTVEYAYRRGGLSLLDFLDAERSYRETALSHIQALGSYRGAIAQLEAAVGGALETHP